MNEENRIEHLRTVTLLADLKSVPEALRAISKIMEVRDYPKDAEILHEGAMGSELFLLVEGKVNVYRTTPEGDSFKVAMLSSEMHPTFGESALIDLEPRSATIRSETQARCLILDRAAFDRFASQNPHWALPVYRRIAQSVLSRFKKTNDDLMLLYKALMAEIRGH